MHCVLVLWLMGTSYILFVFQFPSHEIEETQYLITRILIWKCTHTYHTHTYSRAVKYLVLSTAFKELKPLNECSQCSMLVWIKLSLSNSYLKFLRNFMPPIYDCGHTVNPHRCWEASLGKWSTWELSLTLFQNSILAQIYASNTNQKLPVICATFLIITIFWQMITSVYDFNYFRRQSKECSVSLSRLSNLS